MQATDLRASAATRFHRQWTAKRWLHRSFDVRRRKQALLFDQWAGLGIVADVPNQGDAVPSTFLGLLLLLLRDKEAQVRVFQNTCHHRGMILFESPRKIEVIIRCHYQSWCDVTDGQMVSTLHVGGPGQNTHADIKGSELGLIQIRSNICRDVVWVKVNGNARVFEMAKANAIKRWRKFELSLFSGEDSSLNLGVNCNWKLA